MTTAMTRIVEHESFKALNRCDDGKYGHYLLNHDVRLLVKYSTSGKGPWQFTFTPDDLRVLAADLASEQQRVFLCLVCGHTTICLLTEEEAQALLEPGRLEQQQLRVECPPRSSMRVSARDRVLGRTIPHSAFPDRLFAREVAS